MENLIIVLGSVFVQSRRLLKKKKWYEVGRMKALFIQEARMV